MKKLNHFEIEINNLVKNLSNINPDKKICVNHILICLSNSINTLKFLDKNIDSTALFGKDCACKLSLLEKQLSVYKEKVIQYEDNHEEIIKILSSIFLFSIPSLRTLSFLIHL